MLNLDKLENPVILFDGVCNYCNAMVNFAIRWNGKKNLRFATLQGQVGSALKTRFNIPSEIDSVVFIDNGKAHVYSAAALGICKHLSFPANLLYGLMVVPRFIRNAIYKWVANNRYKWFGRKDACMVPTKEVKSLFLD